MVETIRSVLHAIPEFLIAIVTSLAGYITGGVVMASVWIWEHFTNKELSRKVVKTGLMAFLLASFFSVWYGERERAGKLAAGLGEERLKVTDEHQVAKDRGTQIVNLGTQIGDLNAQLTIHKAEISNRNNSLTDRDRQLTNRDTQIERLQSQIGGQQRTITELQGQVIKAQQSESPRIVPYRAPYSPAARPGEANPVVFLVLTSRTISPVHMVIACKGEIVRIEGMVLGSTAAVHGLERKIGTKAYQISIETPAWTPVNPLIISIYSAGEFEPCDYSMN